ncbi:hypothetical protein AB0K48_59485, partial [Nonomuraea sp. NPDC055795]
YEVTARGPSGDMAHRGHSFLWFGPREQGALPARSPGWVPAALAVWVAAALIGHYVTWGIPALNALLAAFVLYALAGKAGLTGSNRASAA